MCGIFSAKITVTLLKEFTLPKRFPKKDPRPISQVLNEDGNKVEPSVDKSFLMKILLAELVLNEDPELFTNSFLSIIGFRSCCTAKNIQSDQR